MWKENGWEVTESREKMGWGLHGDTHYNETDTGAETLVKRPGEAGKEENQRKNKLFKKASQRQSGEGHLDS